MTASQSTREMMFPTTSLGLKLEPQTPSPAHFRSSQPRTTMRFSLSTEKPAPRRSATPATARPETKCQNGTGIRVASRRGSLPARVGTRKLRGLRRNAMTKPKQLDQHHHDGRAWLLACGLATGVLSASFPAKGDSCNLFEILELSAPALTVIDGPGIAADEQANWTSVSGFQVQSGADRNWVLLNIGRSWFDLERISP
jgi:hypothetical protein